MSIVSYPSICIPRTLYNFDSNIIKNSFEIIFGIGSIQSVYIIVQQNSTPIFCRVFIHFNFWPNDINSTMIRQKLIDGQTIKVVYDNPWFWKCSASRFSKPDNGYKLN